MTNALAIIAVALSTFAPGIVDADVLSVASLLRTTNLEALVACIR